MFRFSLRTKLIAAFSLILLPVTLLFVSESRQNWQRRETDLLNAQFLTAQALSIQVSEAFDAVVSLCWAVANDPLVKTMDTKRLDPHMRRLLSLNPKYTSISVFDRDGISRGWGNATDPAEPRLDISDFHHFRFVMDTNRPFISEVIQLRRPAEPGFAVVVPIRDQAERPIGVVDAVLLASRLSERYTWTGGLATQEVFLMDYTGRLAFHTALKTMTIEQADSLKNNPSVKKALAGNSVKDGEFKSPLGSFPSLTVLYPTRDYGWVLGVSLPRSVAFAEEEAARRSGLIGIIGILMFSSLLGMILARYLTKPVLHLRNKALELGRGHFNSPIRLKTGDELEKLAESFNQMADQIQVRESELSQLVNENVRLYEEAQQAIRMREEFMSIASHELKTPLTPLRIQFQLIARLLEKGRLGSLSQKQIETILNSGEHEIDRLVRLTDDLLDVSRLQSGNMQLMIKSLNLSELVQSVVSSFREQFDLANVKLTVDTEPEVWISGDEFRLEQVLTNLFTNAIKYGVGKPVEITVKRVLSQAQVRVRDHGIGIDVKDQARIFGRFERAVSGRSFGGLGLGLYISDQIVRAHQGTIQVESISGEGSTFVVELPTA